MQFLRHVRTVYFPNATNLFIAFFEDHLTNFVNKYKCKGISCTKSLWHVCCP